MIKKYTFIPALLAMILSVHSCMLMPINVGYLKMEPDIDRSRKMYPYPLNIVLGNKIKDNFTIKGSVRDVNIKEFRKTLEDLLNPAFEKNYREVIVSSMEQNRGLELVFNRIEPYQVQHRDGIQIAIRLHAELLKDGVPKGEIRGDEVGGFKAVTIFQIDQAMESSLQNLMRVLYDRYMQMVDSLRM